MPNMLGIIVDVLANVLHYRKELLRVRSFGRQLWPHLMESGTALDLPFPAVDRHTARVLPEIERIPVRRSALCEIPLSASCQKQETTKMYPKMHALLCSIF